MAKCECCGLKDAVHRLAGDVPDTEGLKGVWFSLDCLTFFGQQELCNRIRARRTKAEQPSDTIPSPPPIERTAIRHPLNRNWVSRDGGVTWGVDIASSPSWYADLATEFEKAICAIIEPSMEFVADRDSDPVKSGVLKGTIREKFQEMIEIIIEPTMPKLCRECSRPERPIAATHGELCVYCDRRSNHERPALTLREKLNQAGARHRNETALAAEKTKPSKSSRELAKGHPSTWPSQDGEL